MATSRNNAHSSSASAGTNYQALAAAATKSVEGEAAKRPYYGKCQYKTGKCFNERTLKRNGDAHSLCEEHRIKQNLIQRRSDRKYQTVHAIRRRERSQRRAVLKKQVSMAVAQQLFFEHQQQKSLGGLPLHVLANGLSTPTTATITSSPRNQQDVVAISSITNPSSLVPPIQIPAASGHNLPFILETESSAVQTTARHIAPASAPLIVPYQLPRTEAASATVMTPFIKLEPQQQQQRAAELVGCKPGDESSPTGIDDFTPDTFLNICAAGNRGGALDNGDSIAGSLDLDDEDLDLGEDFAPIVSCRSERELWTDEDIEFLQTLLLP